MGAAASHRFTEQEVVTRVSNASKLLGPDYFQIQNSVYLSAMKSRNMKRLEHFKALLGRYSCWIRRSGSFVDLISDLINCSGRGIQISVLKITRTHPQFNTNT